MHFESSRLKRPSEKELRLLYLDQRLTTRAIGERYGVSKTSVGRWLIRYGIDRRPANNGLAARGLTAPSKELLYVLVHVQHMSLREIGTRFHVDAGTVRYWLRSFGIDPPTVWGTRYKGRDPQLPGPSELRRLYADDELSLREIGRRLGVSDRTIVRLCAEFRIPMRHDDGWSGGFRHMCQDGHQVRSTYERQVDDWLSTRCIAHLYEPTLPFDRRFKADFLALGCYIEVWGVRGDPIYSDRARRKRLLYAAHTACLIEIPDYAFAPSRHGLWERKLAKLLEPNSTQAPVQSALFS